MKTRIHVNQHIIKQNRALADVECPVCWAGQGQPCLTPKSKQRTNHARRGEGLPPQPVITVKDYKQNRYGFTAEVLDEDTGDVVVRVVYRPEKPLSCGAVLWVETDNPVVVDGEELPK